MDVLQLRIVEVGLQFLEGFCFETNYKDNGQKGFIHHEVGILQCDFISRNEPMLLIFLQKMKLLYFCCAITLLWKISSSFFSYSGYNKPPKFGDFEAQRHWMEITTQLHATQWYENSTQNDLFYWGLDYPPLTAYHSYFNGKLSQYLIGNSSLINLFSSRGIEYPFAKFFMRFSVLLSDVAILIPSLLMILLQVKSIRSSDVLLLFTFPLLWLIDNGHFQYNNMSIGFTLLAFYYCTFKMNAVVASIWFCFALQYKQMSLYYSLPFFCHLIRVYVLQGTTLFETMKRFGLLGCTVLTTFVLLWLPWIVSSVEKSSFDPLLQVVLRIFPFYRGLFEDKVGNFWCTSFTFIKWNRYLSQESIIKMSTLCTLLFSLPSNWIVLMRNTSKHRSFLFANSLTLTSLSFFLFSFHVHEKTILFCTIPALLSLCLLPKEFQYYSWYQFITFHFCLIATFSNYPLMVKDDLQILYFISILFYWAIYELVKEKKRSKWINALEFLLWTAMLTIHFLMEFVALPERYPDLFTLFCTSFSCFYFFFYFFSTQWVQWKISSLVLRQ